MIIPMMCFSCGKPIAPLWESYLAYVKEAETETKTEAAGAGAAAAASAAPPAPVLAKTPEFRAMARLGIGRECCRRMLLCQHDMYDKVK
jgi:DNA-directed RNA polymerase subunit N (RpoN/RPB10)